MEWRSFVLFTVLVLFSVAMLSEITVDATRPGHERKREPTVIKGGGIGRKLPVGVTLERVGGAADDEGMTVVQFTITNSSNTPLTIPISTSPGDFEPADSKLAYTTAELSLYVTLERGFGASRRSTVLAGGAHLYGSPAIAGTTVTLAPAESIRVLARIALPGPSDTCSRDVLVGNVSVNVDTVKTVGGQTSSELQEVGSAMSQDYSIDKLSTVE
jgi:hypothetical protein